MGWDKGELTRDRLGFDLQVTVCRRQCSSLALKYRLGGKSNNNNKKNPTFLSTPPTHPLGLPQSPRQLPAHCNLSPPFHCTSVNFSHTLISFPSVSPSASVDSHLLLPSWLLRRACLVQKSSRIPGSKHACGVIIARNVASETRLRRRAFPPFSFLSKCLRILC